MSETKIRRAYGFCAVCGGVKEFDPNYVRGGCYAQDRKFGFCAVCGGVKALDKTYVHKACLATAQPAPVLASTREG